MGRAERSSGCSLEPVDSHERVDSHEPVDSHELVESHARVETVMSEHAEARQWSGLEIPALFAVLMGGAVIRYWLSTVIPFDASEFEALTEAQVRSRSVRGIFVMVNGLALLALYLILRRSAGVAETRRALPIETGVQCDQQAA